MTNLLGAHCLEAAEDRIFDPRHSASGVNKSMYLRDLVVYADDAIVERYKGGFVSRFHREASSVVDQYMYEIHRKVITTETAKVGFIFSDEIKQPPENTPSWCFYPWPFDFATYTALSTNEAKQRLILDSLHAAMIWIAAGEGWPTDSFETAYNKIIDRNFKFVGYSKMSWLCPSKRFRARIYFDWRLDGITLFAVLTRNRSKTELARSEFGTAIASGGILDHYLNAGKWKSNTEFAFDTSLLFRKELVIDFAHVIAQHKT